MSTFAYFFENAYTSIAPNSIKYISPSPQKVLSDLFPLIYYPTPRGNNVITFASAACHRNETLRDLESRRINKRLELGNRGLGVESIPVFFLPFIHSNSDANMDFEAE